MVRKVGLEKFHSNLGTKIIPPAETVSRLLIANAASDRYTEHSTQIRLYSPNSTNATETHGFLMLMVCMVKRDLAYMAADTIMNKSKVTSWNLHSNRGRQTKKNKQEDLYRMMVSDRRK